MKLNLIYILLFIFALGFTSEEARKGNEAFNKGEFETAEQLYRSAIELEPDNAKIYFNLGNALAKQGKVEEAIESYLQYQELADTPEDQALAQYNIGAILAETDKWKPAVHHFKESLKLNPMDAEARHNFELASLKAQEEEEEQQQDQQQQQDQEQKEPSEYAKAMKKRAEQLVAEQRYQQAYDLMQQALSVDETVQNFNDFIERINTVNQIDN
ncbi:tetratricopeptide repeat protein [Balneola vulgaris]|jgi:tetratricopeptide (TPR) repeat protein|uniref:tetratricopeptide repeat protein n=1 Tax=Balneola vulgaris TaxID=287535 RepID=UPI00037BB697|nr:tetratricopeptide repeat protein [Balneola vulgaris]